MQTKIDAARALLYYTAEVIDRGLSPDTLGSETKNFVAKVVMDVTIDAVQVLGGYGLMKDYPVEKYMRDAKVFSIFEGTTQINQQTLPRPLPERIPRAKVSRANGNQRRDDGTINGCGADEMMSILGNQFCRACCALCHGWRRTNCHRRKR